MTFAIRLCVKSIVNHIVVLFCAKAIGDFVLLILLIISYFMKETKSDNCCGPFIHQDAGREGGSPNFQGRLILKFDC